MYKAKDRTYLLMIAVLFAVLVSLLCVVTVYAQADWPVIEWYGVELSCHHWWVRWIFPAVCSRPDRYTVFCFGLDLDEDGVGDFCTR